MTIKVAPQDAQTQDETEDEDEDAPEVSGKKTLPVPTDDEVDEDDMPETEMSERAGNHSNIEQSDTQRTFDRNVRTELKSDDLRETNYVTIPEIDVDSVLIKFETIRDALKKHFVHKTLEKLKDSLDARSEDQILNDKIVDKLDEIKGFQEALDPDKGKSFTDEERKIAESNLEVAKKQLELLEGQKKSQTKLQEESLFKYGHKSLDSPSSVSHSLLRIEL